MRPLEKYSKIKKYGNLPYSFWGFGMFFYGFPQTFLDSTYYMHELGVLTRQPSTSISMSLSVICHYGHRPIPDE